MSNKQLERRFNMFKTVAAIAVALVFGFAVIGIVSEDPGEALRLFLFGPLERKTRIGNIFESMTPLLFTGTAICVMYQANVFNMVGEGAFLISAAMATWFATTHMTMARLPLIVICFIIGILSGIMAALIPAVLKIKYKANELVSSLMMNYILLKLSDYLLLYKLIDTDTGWQASRPLPQHLTRIWEGTKVHSGFIIGLVLCVVFYLFIYRTKWGYEIRMVGVNQSFAKYSGISVMAVALVTQLIGGGIAGLGGAVEMLGFYDRFVWFGTQPGYGFDGVLVGVLAGNNPLMVPVSALFLAYVRVGAACMSRASDVPVEFVDVLQGIIIILVAAELFLAKTKHKLIVNNAKKLLEKEEKENA